MTSIGLLTLHIKLHGCASLKEKRGRLQPLISKLRKEYNLSVAEVDHLEKWGDALLACTLVSNDPIHTRRSLQKVADWVVENWRDVDVVDDHIELL